MKIAVITSGLLPIPAVLGGAVENLIDFYLEYNEREHLHDITVFSVINSKSLALLPTFVKCNNNHYYYIRTDSFLYRAKRKLFGIFHKRSLYYHYQIEYFLYKVLSQIKKTKYDLIVLENRPGYALKVSKKFPNIPIILHLHNDLMGPNSYLAEKMKSCISLTITVSKYIKNRVDIVHSLSLTSVCYNGIDLSHFHSHFNRSEMRNHLGLSDTDFVIVFSGRIIPEKGIKELIEAFVKVKKFPMFKLLVLGGSFFGNDITENSFMKEMRILGESCKSQIVFTGFQSYDRMPSLLRGADIAVIPSIWEDPCPLSCIEAMAAGLPLIITRSGGMPELVDDQCAIVLEKDDILSSQIARNIVYLYQNPGLRKEMSQHAISRSNSLFGKDKYSKEFFEEITKFYQSKISLPLAK